jgi:hypothetical protein
MEKESQLGLLLCGTHKKWAETKTMSSPPGIKACFCPVQLYYKPYASYVDDTNILVSRKIENRKNPVFYRQVN